MIVFFNWDFLRIFAKRHHLPSPSAVVSAVKGLLEKDFITQDKNVYKIYDQFFQLWLEREVFESKR